jgi:agmatine/peptidylarginine deiminase
MFGSMVTYTVLSQAELPIGFTDLEWKNRHLIHQMHRSATMPPTGNVRMVAEYEPMQGALIRYPFGIPVLLIREFASSAKVYCLVTLQLEEEAYSEMESGGVDMNNVEFILGPTDSYWTRDYGPWWIVDGNGALGVVDFTYNRPRPNDNSVPGRVADYLNVQYFSANLIATGGNIMTDGFGIAASTHITYTENPQCGTNDETSVPLASCEVVDQTMSKYFGIETYHVVADPNDEYVDHIDCWGKFLSDSTLLLRQVPPGHAQYREIEKVVSYFNTTTTVKGERWNIVRVYTPNDEPYTNSFILNDKVFVPINNSEELDARAISTYENAMPGYTILPFSGNWKSTDALHCRVKGIPDFSQYNLGCTKVQALFFQNACCETTSPYCQDLEAQYTNKCCR